MEALIQQVLVEVRSIRSDMQEMKADIQHLKTDVQGLKSDMLEVKTDVHGLKTDVQNLRTEMRTGFDEVNKKIHILYEQVGRNTEQQFKLDEVIVKVSELDTDVKLIKKMSIG